MANVALLMLRSGYHSIARAMLCSLTCPSQQPAHIIYKFILKAAERAFDPPVLGDCSDSKCSQAEYKMMFIMLCSKLWIYQLLIR